MFIYLFNFWPKIGKITIWT